MARQIDPSSAADIRRQRVRSELTNPPSRRSNNSDDDRRHRLATDEPQFRRARRRMNRAALSPAAERALAEAAERRAQAAQDAAARPKELNGRDGPDPARYGDWESRGIASDF